VNAGQVRLRKGDHAVLLEPVLGWNDRAFGIEVAAGVECEVVLEPDEEDGWYAVEVPLPDGRPWVWFHAKGEQLAPFDMSVAARLHGPASSRLAGASVGGPAGGASRRAHAEAADAAEVAPRRTWPPRRGQRDRSAVITTEDGRRYVVWRLGRGWVCAPPGAGPDPNAVVPALRDAIALATGIGPDAPWVSEQVRRILGAEG
jgi:hypothetical protein